MDIKGKEKQGQDLSQTAGNKSLSSQPRQCSYVYCQTHLVAWPWRGLPCRRRVRGGGEEQKKKVDYEGKGGKKKWKRIDEGEEAE